MRRVLLAISLLPLAFSLTQAQEAFYIYRNDGKFHGFFYDEVIELRQSKIGVDSVEYDKWVTQEVVLADTTYRIPLSAIDSIGFQQPEIKINPNVRYLQKEGLAPYLDVVTEDNMCFMNIPESMLPKVGEVWIGLPTDECSEKYAELGGSFSLVVTSVYYYPGYSTVWGRPVEKLGEVFEQYITVEEIGVDPEGKVVRRIAGCTPDGLPRPVQKASGHKEVTIIDMEKTVSDEVEIGEHVKLTFDVDLAMKVLLRASYNINMFRLNVTINNDFIISAQPTLGVKASGSFNRDVRDQLPNIGAIIFPAACPVFETNPVPTLFIRGEGSIEAKFSLPKVSLITGVDYYIDTDMLPFPIGSSFHYSTSGFEPFTFDMFKSTGEIKFSGYTQAGVEFQARINSASWFKKILEFGIGFNLYCGPRLDGEFTYNFGAPDIEQEYDVISNGFIKHTWMSLGLEATAKAKLGWDDPKSTTFFNKDWDFFSTYMRLAPKIDSTRVKVDEINENAAITVYAQPSANFLYNYMTLEAYDTKMPPTSTILARWGVAAIKEGQKFSTSMNLKGLKADPISVTPMLYTSGDATDPLPVYGAAVSFAPPTKLSLDRDVVDLVHGEKPFMIVTTNAGKDKFIDAAGSKRIWSSVRVDTLNYAEGIYKLTFIPPTAPRTLFDYPTVHPDDDGAPYVYTWTYNMEKAVKQNFGFRHTAGGTPDHFDVSVVTNGGEQDMIFANFFGPVKAVRQGSNTFVIKETFVSDDEFSTITSTIDMTITRASGYDFEDWEDKGDHYIASGTVKQVLYDKTIGKTKYNTTSTFNNIEGTQADGARGKLTSASGTFLDEEAYDCSYTDEKGVYHEKTCYNYKTVSRSMSSPSKSSVEIILHWWYDE